MKLKLSVSYSTVDGVEREPFLAITTSNHDNATRDVVFVKTPKASFELFDNKSVDINTVLSFYAFATTRNDDSENGEDCLQEIAGNMLPIKNIRMNESITLNLLPHASTDATLPIKATIKLKALSLPSLSNKKPANMTQIDKALGAFYQNNASDYEMGMTDRRWGDLRMPIVRTNTGLQYPAFLYGALHTQNSQTWWRETFRNGIQRAWPHLSADAARREFLKATPDLQMRALAMSLTIISSNVPYLPDTTAVNVEGRYIKKEIEQFTLTNELRLISGAKVTTGDDCEGSMGLIMHLASELEEMDVSAIDDDVTLRMKKIADNCSICFGLESVSGAKIDRDDKSQPLGGHAVAVLVPNEILLQWINRNKQVSTTINRFIKSDSEFSGKLKTMFLEGTNTVDPYVVDPNWMQKEKAIQQLRQEFPVLRRGRSMMHVPYGEDNGFYFGTLSLSVSRLARNGFMPELTVTMNDTVGAYHKEFLLNDPSVGVLPPKNVSTADWSAYAELYKMTSPIPAYGEPVKRAQIFKTFGTKESSNTTVYFVYNRQLAENLQSSIQKTIDVLKGSNIASAVETVYEPISENGAGNWLVYISMQ